jgi:hypothetical protein
LFLQWARHGGLSQKEGIRARRLLPHLALAVFGLALWVGYLATDNGTVAWIAVGILVAAALLGISMLVISLRGRTTTVRTETPAEGMFPFPSSSSTGARDDHASPQRPRGGWNLKLEADQGSLQSNAPCSSIIARMFT